MIYPGKIPQEFSSNPGLDRIAIRIKALIYGFSGETRKN